MYLSGFGNHHQSEAIKGALPKDQNSPQKCEFGLYAEQLSGSAFTRPRHLNLHSWLYRQLPSAMHFDYQPATVMMQKPFAVHQAPNPMRWSALPQSADKRDFLNGITHIAGNTHMHAYIYQCNESMTTSYFSNHDSELLFVPYLGKIRLRTELGILEVSPGMIAVVPRGIKFKVELLEGTAAGYLGENCGLPFNLPQLGPIGANGLANPRHFLYPKAAIEELPKAVKTIHLICKYQNKMWLAESNHSPLNVAAWHGNYAPYLYDLSLFNTINTVSFDHPDPSIFTILTSESEIPGVANFDFVIFPPRWMVAEHTFRPPYFHRNIMNEFMGLLRGEYDAKASGFEVGGISIHNYMTSHGPDVSSFKQASLQHLEPKYYDNTLAFMFETREPWLFTEAALAHPARQLDYTACWQDFR